ncbi:pyridine nucleotide-disulfide oxidoreductase [Sanguibacteroides justesenii]|uniref:FAD-dependent oxidoreductase n=1 Tax=Sanguibacteroides justesenii TaxID=1547597 RepID=UPI000D86ECC0|nr:FAD-dependent oxidoreductase [Sanguibacteroides justesenii]PXZ44900.1 pyridine nucleotide-disulfide oxidoreductase [Sanguibacteroides justesenii]
MKQYDAIIIGFGKGGKTLATGLAKRNWTVAMIERSAQMYGGTCINIGCIPTKTLVHQAKIDEYKDFASFEEKRAFYRQAVQKKNEVTALLRKKNYHNLADEKNITVYTGTGSFVSPEVVSVQMPEGNVQLKAKYIFINTGAETIVPSIDGIEESKRVYTSTSIMELADLPRHLVIVGGGYIGLEFASMYASFGSEVTVLEGFNELIPKEDRDIAANVKEVLEKKGIRFYMGVKVTSIQDKGETAIVSYQTTENTSRTEIKADAVLLATGRKPNTAGLNLESTGIKTNERGAIVTDEHLRTNIPHIYAMGDATGGLQFTYISLDDSRIVSDDLFGDQKRNTSDRNPVSYSVFIDPPLSRVGISEEEARKNKIEIVVKKLAVASIPRTLTVGETEGVLKAIIDAKTNQILGCTLFCTDSHEMINTIALAIKTGQDYRVLRDFIYTHPSMTESFNVLLS